LHLGIFEQPEKNDYFSSFLIEPTTDVMIISHLDFLRILLFAYPFLTAASWRKAAPTGEMAKIGWPTFDTG